jgi:hypothetical protein
VGLKVVDDRVDPPDVGRDPRLSLLQEIRPVGRAAAGVRLGQRLTGRRAECPEDVPFAAPPVVDLLAGAFGGTVPAFGIGLWFRADDLLSREALGRLRTHLVEADDGAALRRAGVEFLDRPLFAAKSGSTRSPNQVSCFLQQRPSPQSNSSIRLRFIGMPFCSLR